MNVCIVEVVIYLLRYDRSNVREALLQTLHRGASSREPGVLVCSCVERELRDWLDLIGDEPTICRRKRMCYIARFRSAPNCEQQDDGYPDDKWNENFQDLTRIRRKFVIKGEHFFV